MKDTLIQFLVIMQLAAGFGIGLAYIYGYFFDWNGDYDELDSWLVVVIFSLIVTFLVF